MFVNARFINADRIPTFVRCIYLRRSIVRSVCRGEIDQPPGRIDRTDMWLFWHDRKITREHRCNASRACETPSIDQEKGWKRKEKTNVSSHRYIHIYTITFLPYAIVRANIVRMLKRNVLIKRNTYTVRIRKHVTPSSPRFSNVLARIAETKASIKGGQSVSFRSNRIICLHEESTWICLFEFADASCDSW